MVIKDNPNEVAISVIIPIYDVERYLCECIDSVLAQTVQDYEIILVDDGATDASGRMCDQYAAKETKIRVIHQPNGGLSAARNTGLAMAKGKYVYFLDSDDKLEKQTLEHLWKLAEQERADVVFFDAYVFFSECEPDPNVYTYERSKQYVKKSGRQMLDELLDTDEYRTAVPLMLLRREYIEKNNLGFKVGILHEDELFTFLVYYADGIVAHCHEKLYARRIRPASIMTAASMRNRYDSMYVIYYELSDLYKKKEICGKVSERYLARIVRSVLAKYTQLTGEDKEKYCRKQRNLKKDVISNKGYHDIKLKIKCSSGIRKFYYKVENKILQCINS